MRTRMGFVNGDCSGTVTVFRIDPDWRHPEKGLLNNSGNEHGQQYT